MSPSTSAEITGGAGQPAPIHTARLELRAATPSDLEAFFAIMSDPQAMRHWSTLPHDNPDVTRDWLDRMIAGAASGHERALVLDGRVIGKAGAHRAPEVGFILAPAHWGKGYVVEAMAALIPHIWATSNHDHLFADVDPRNIGSIRVLEKLGFSETHRAERTYLIGGEWSDSVYLRLNRP